MGSVRVDRVRPLSPGRSRWAHRAAPGPRAPAPGRSGTATLCRDRSIGQTTRCLLSTSSQIAVYLVRVAECQ
jgi:hypothetical protein